MEQAKQEGAFTFTWQLLAQFDDQMQELQLAQLRIPMITFDRQFPERNKEEVLSLIQDIVDEQTQVFTE